MSRKLIEAAGKWNSFMFSCDGLGIPLTASGALLIFSADNMLWCPRVSSRVRLLVTAIPWPLNGVTNS